MTWIIGIAPPFGYSILVSDICVTFADSQGKRTYQDCLQKLYPLGHFILGGFAGSVKIGFRLLGRLQLDLSQLGDDEAWNLDIISNTWWPRLARRIFKESEEEEKKLGGQVILAAAHPRKNRGNVSWPRTDIYTFSWPAFEPKKADPLEVLTIGSGSQVPQYITTLKKVCSGFTFMQMATLGETGQAKFLGHQLSRIAEEDPVAGISQLFQIGLITRGKWAIANHEYSMFSQDGTQTNFRFPPLARNYHEFLDLCETHSLIATGAYC